MHHKGFVKGLFVILTFNVDQRSLDNAASILWVDCVSKITFPQHAPAHTTFTLIDRMKMGVRHPGGIEMDRRDIQRLFDPVGVVEQAIIG